MVSLIKVDSEVVVIARLVNVDWVVGVKLVVMVEVEILIEDWVSMELVKMVVLSVTDIVA